MSDDKTQRLNTRMVHAGRGHLGADTSPVNPPIVRSSTVLYRNIGVRTELADRKAKGERVWSYGTSGSSVSFALEDAISEIEGGARTMLFGSGLARLRASAVGDPQTGRSCSIRRDDLRSSPHDRD